MSSIENDGSYVWQVPNNPSDECLVRISDIDGEPSDESDAIFTLGSTYCIANEADLIAALNNAKDNGQDDLIKIQQGTYNGNFVYASTEAFGVTIAGGYTVGCGSRMVNPDNTVLDGGEIGVVLALSAPDVVADFAVDGLTLQNGNVVDNSGGGLYATTDGTVTLTNNIISDNSTQSRGGGIYFNSGNGAVILTNNTISNNNANEISGGGGFFNSTFGTVTLTNNTITDNSANSFGGVVISAAAGTAILTNNIITGNNANFAGGGGHFYTDSGAVILTNNTITDNNANSYVGGGYFFTYEGTLTLTNNTISNNNTNGFGGGVRVYLGNDDTIANIHNNIIWNNSAVTGGNDLYIENDVNNNYFPSAVNLDYNDFDQSPDGIYIQIPFPIDPSNLNNEDPLFVDPANDDYRLTVGSPCKDSGINSAPELPTTDQDGNPRIMDGIVDMGAFEYPGTVPPIIDSFIASPTSGEVPLTVTFTCVAHDFGGSINTYTLDHGDGTSRDNITGLFSYDYVTAGTYDAICTVVDNDGESNTSEPLTITATGITVISPNGGEELSASETFEITWAYEGNIENVKIEYSVNNGTDWIEIIESTENDGSYIWDVPCDLSDESLIGISDVDGDAYDESDEIFSIEDLDSDNDGTPDCLDSCPNDPNKIDPGICGCGTPDTDSDGDGVADCNDGCPSDPNKTEPGICGCGVADTDTDNDGTPDCNDGCLTDPNKTDPGICGCGVSDTDSDVDGVADCNDGCPTDPNKTESGICGCGVADVDTDGDGTLDCNDNCPSDPNKTEPGLCGCGIADTDSDVDGTPDCNDGCPTDPNKTVPGICGCGTPDTDSDLDGTPDCIDNCPNDPNKTVPGLCGCGFPDTDSDGDGTADCNDNCPNDPNKIEPGLCGCGFPDIAFCGIITVASPDGGEELFAGATFEITWTYEGDIENVKIEYSVNNGTDWIEITANTENDGSYIWDVPFELSDECLVRITDVDGEPFDVSDEVFTITPPICKADFNDDKIVDEMDLEIFSIAMGETDCTWWPPLCDCDINGDDNDIDGADLAVLTREFGRDDCP